jgi:hypothetical protein
VSRESQRRCAADAGTAPGDQGDLAGEHAVHGVVLSWKGEVALGAWVSSHGQGLPTRPAPHKAKRASPW